MHFQNNLPVLQERQSHDHLQQKLANEQSKTHVSSQLFAAFFNVTSSRVLQMTNLNSDVERQVLAMQELMKETNSAGSISQSTPTMLEFT